MKDKLFPEFSPVSTEEWLERIKKDLKGKNFEILIRKTLDNIHLQPFYRKEDTENLILSDYLPSEYPYLRGYKTNNKWKIRLDVFYDSPEKTNKKIKHLLDTGVDEIGIDFEEKPNLVYEDFKELLQNLDLEKTAIHYKSLYNIHQILPLLEDYIAEKNFDPNKIKGSINFDLFTEYAFTGDVENFYRNFDIMLFLLKNKKLSQFKIFSVNIEKYANAGASPVIQLAIALSILAEYIHFATNQGISPPTILKKTVFNFAVGSEYFMEIAKISSFRYLYHKLLSPYYVFHVPAYIHTVTIRRNKTLYDPYVNMLRTTIEGMAAVLAGTDSLNIEPFDIIFRKPDEFSERMAKNQQLIFKYEAYLDKIADPSGGSYYVENIRKQLIENAWNLFLEIENRGGFIKALEYGFISDLVFDIDKKEKDLVNKGKIAILGTNKYPNRKEKINFEINPPKTYRPIPQANFKPLKESRLAEDFENLRMKTEKNSKIPKVFLFTYGNVAMRRARADFSSNFFAIAGFEIIDNIGFDTLNKGLEKWEETKAEITVLCSADETYMEMVEHVLPKLADKTILVIAGNPENRTDLENKGVKHFIHIKSNILEELKKFQNLTLYKTKS